MATESIVRFEELLIPAGELQSAIRGLRMLWSRICP